MANGLCQVDPRALGETATHRVEWRPAILRGLDRQGGWQTAAVRSQGKCGKAALCTWDLEDLKDLKDLEAQIAWFLLFPISRLEREPS